MANFVLQRNADSSIGVMLSTYAPAGVANDPEQHEPALPPNELADAGSTSATASAHCRQQNSSACSDTMMGIETGQPAPARQLATLNSPGRGGKKRAMTMLEQQGAPVNPR